MAADALLRPSWAESIQIDPERSIERTLEMIEMRLGRVIFTSLSFTDFEGSYLSLEVE